MSTKQEPDSIVAARRRFLASCGRFAVVTPPAITLMLAGSRQSFAVAVSGAPHGGGPVTRFGQGHPPRRARHGNNGYGNGGGDGTPGKSGKRDDVADAGR